jgi:hypothetical protein
MPDWDKPAEKPAVDRWGKKPHEERQNKRLDKKLGGRAVPGSGRFSGAKGDRELGGLFKIEEKSTDSQSIAIRRKYLEKIYKEAKQQDKEAALAFSFLKGKSPAPSDWIAIPVTLFREMYHCFKESGR